MDTLIDAGLPLSLVLMTFSLGLGLTAADFRRVVSAPRGVLAGALAQLVLLPVVALTLVLAFGVTGDLALGIMILSVCPGGVTSNVVTRLAGGAVALSVTLTGLISLISVISAPLLVSVFMGTFQSEAPLPPLPLPRLVATLFVLTAVPILSGMAVRHVAPVRAGRLEKPALALGVTVFVTALTIVTANDTALLADGIDKVGEVLLTLAVLMCGLGWLVARLFTADRREQVAVSIEATLQNGPMGVTIALLLQPGPGPSDMALPSGLYAAAMYLVAGPLVMAHRAQQRRRDAA